MANFYQYLNGWDKPIFTKRNQYNQILETLELPLPNETQMEEFLIIKQINFVDIVDTSSQIVTGFKLRWEIPYEVFFTVDTGKKIKSILEWKKTAFQIWLQPNKDINWRVYEVVLSMEEISHKIIRAKSNAIGNKGMVLAFETVRRFDEVPWGDPNNPPYAGFQKFKLFNQLF